jgi:hypothetical protein
MGVSSSYDKASGRLLMPDGWMATGSGLNTSGRRALRTGAKQSEIKEARVVEWWWLISAFAAGMLARPLLDALMIRALRDWRPYRKFRFLNQGEQEAMQRALRKSTRLVAKGKPVK